MGLAVHRSVLAAGDAETGVTIHEVTAELDAGPILAQVAGAGDARATMPETLAARVLAEEHRLLVATLRGLGADTLRRTPGRRARRKGSAGMRRASMPDGAGRGADPRR